MDTATLGFALAAGLVAAFNPCGFAMLPSYLTLVVLGAEEQRSRLAAVSRALAATTVMAAGFVSVFAAFGLVVAPLASQVQRYLPIVTIVIGALLIGMGVWMVSGRELAVLLPKPRRGSPTGALRSMYLYGIVYALASLSCTLGPFMAVTAGTFRSGSVLGGVLAYLAYAAGMAVVVGVLSAGIAIAGAGVTSRARKLIPYINRIGGALIIVVGLYVGYYGFYETRLYLGDGDADDVVIDAATGIQQILASWIDAVGIWPILGVLLVLVSGVLVLGKFRSRRTAKSRTTMSDTADP